MGIHSNTLKSTKKHNKSVKFPPKTQGALGYQSIGGGTIYYFDGKYTPLFYNSSAPKWSDFLGLWSGIGLF